MIGKKFFDKLRNSGKQKAETAWDSLGKAPSFGENTDANESESQLDAETAKAIQEGYFEGTSEEKVQEEVLTIMDWTYTHHDGRRGDFKDSPYSYYQNGEDADKMEFLTEGVKDATERYFSENSPEEAREIMSRILRKLRFGQDLGEHLGLSDDPRFASKPSFTATDFCRMNIPRAGEGGVPSELANYELSFSSEELSLLANADSDDALASCIKVSMPDKIQKDILAQMSDEKFKEIVAGNMDEIVANGEAAMSSAGTDAARKELEHQKAVAGNIKGHIPKLTNRSEIQKILDQSGFKIYSVPERHEFVGIERNGENGYTL